MNTPKGATIRTLKIEEKRIEYPNQEVAWAYEQIPSDEGWRVIRSGGKHLEAGKVSGKISLIVAQRYLYNDIPFELK